MFPQKNIERYVTHTNQIAVLWGLSRTNQIAALGDESRTNQITALGYAYTNQSVRELSLMSWNYGDEKVPQG